MNIRKLERMGADWGWEPLDDNLIFLVPSLDFDRCHGGCISNINLSRRLCYIHLSK